jgi:hypothetical protein
MSAAGDGFAGGRWVVVSAMLPGDRLPGDPIYDVRYTPTGCQTVLISRKLAIQ